MATTREEIRKDPETGKFFLWEVIEGDLPGEGGARRLDEVSLTTITRHELALREAIEDNKAQGMELNSRLTRALDFKAQMEALGT